MKKRIASLALAAGLSVGAAFPAYAVTNDARATCDPASQPASVQRVERHPVASPVTIRTWVVYQQSTCVARGGIWVVNNTHVHEWKRYSRESSTPCQVFARDRNTDNGNHWSRWRGVPWMTATNC